MPMNLFDGLAHAPQCVLHVTKRGYRTKERVRYCTDRTSVGKKPWRLSSHSITVPWPIPGKS